MGSIRQALVSSLLGQPFNVVLLLIGTIVSTRLLSPDERGVFSGVVAAFTIVQILQTFGAGVHVIRRSLDENEARQSYTITWIGCLAAFATLQLFAYPIAQLLTEPRAETVIRILSLSSLVAPLEVQFGGQLMREMRGKAAVICTLIKTASVVSTSIVFILLGYSYLGMAIGFVAGTISYAACTFIAVRNTPRFVGFRIPTMSFLKRSAALTGFLASKNASERLIHPAVLAIQGAYAAGILGTAWGILDMAKQVLVDAMMIFMTPLLSGHSNDPRALRFYFAKMTAIIGGIVPPAFLAVACLSEEFIGFLFGAKWLASAHVMTIFSIAGAIHYSTIGYADLLIAQKKDSKAFQIELGMGILCLTIFVISLQHSLEAAAWSRVFYSSCAFAMSLFIANQTAQLDWLNLTIVIGKNILIATFTILPAIALKLTNLTPDLRLFIATLLGILGFLLAIMIFKHPLSSEIVRLVNKVRGKLPFPAGKN
jgi:O-antigen/teichoic acid export membrane protein